MSKSRAKSIEIQCKKCGAVCQSNKSGNGLCRKCYAHDYYLKHRDAIIQRANNWVENNIEHYRATRRKISRRKYQKLTVEQRREIDRKRALKMGAEERERRKQRSREYYANNKSKSLEYSRKRRKENPQARKVSENKRRALKKGVEADLTTAQWMKIIQAYDYKCAYCGEKKKLTQDHVIPLSKGGKHTANNVVPACQSCNSKKHDNPPPKPVKIVML